MLKLLGSCMILAGAFGVGLCICQERKSRVQQLETLAHIFDLIAGEISYARISLPEIFQEVGEKTGAQTGTEPGCSLFRIGLQLQEGDGQDIRVIWEKEIDAYLSQTRLEEEEKKTILSFPDVVWFLDGTRQEAAVEDFAKGLRVAAMQAEQRRIAMERTTMALCLAAGAMAAILLY